MPPPEDEPVGTLLIQRPDPSNCWMGRMIVPAALSAVLLAVAVAAWRFVV